MKEIKTLFSKKCKQKKRGMKNQKIVFIVIVIIVGLVILSNFGFLPQAEKDIKVNNVLIKSVIKEGDVASDSLKITNLKSEKEFQVSLSGLEGLVSINENNFVLNENEEKDLEITFEDKYLSHGTGIYIGKLIIKTNEAEKEVPVILEIQNKIPLFVSNLEVNPQYKKVTPEDEFSFGIKFFNLKDTNIHTLKLNYFVKNFDGEIIPLNPPSSPQDIAVGDGQLITRTFELPKDISSGNYVLGVMTEFDDDFKSVTTSSYLFSVSKTNFSISNTNSFVIIFSIAVLIFLSAIVVLVVYLIKDRNKMFSQLRRQQTDELRFHSNKIEQRRKVLISKAKPKERSNIISHFKKLKNKAIKKIKKKHRRQKVLFKKLRKHKKKSEMQKKLGEWKRKGFNVGEIMGSKKEDVGKKITKLKGKGFDTHVLDK